MLNAPLSLEALEFARRAAAARYKYPDDRLALSDLLNRWNMGLDMDRTERRMALRIAREHAAIDLPDVGEDQPTRQMASVRKILEGPRDSVEAAEEEKPVRAEPQDGEAGDDDDPEELDVISHSSARDEDPSSDFDEDFYATAIKDINDKA